MQLASLFYLDHYRLQQRVLIGMAFTNQEGCRREAVYLISSFWNKNIRVLSRDHNDQVTPIKQVP